MKSEKYQTESLKKSSNKPLQFASLALAIASANCIPGAVAQEQGQGFGFLEEIVVTARRREESLQDIPVAVTAMDSEALRSQGVGELSDLGTQVPSLRISNAGASTNDPIISLRGQRPTTAGLNQEAAVPMYFGDVVMTPSQGSNLAMYDLQSVQVLKGPQGTLFGRNSTGGAILVQPKTPGVDMGGYLEATVGDYNKRGVEGAVDLPVSDVLQFRLAGRMIDRDGYQENVADNALHGDDYWDEHSRSLRLSTNLEISENLSNLLVLSYDRNEMMARIPSPIVYNNETGLGGLIGSIYGAGDIQDAVAAANARDEFDIATDMRAKEMVENQFAANTTEFHINDNLTVKNIFGYRKMKLVTSADIDGTAFPLFGARTSPTDSVTYDPSTTKRTSEQFSNEFQLLGSYDQVDWIVGGYWYEMSATAEDYSQVFGVNPANPTIWMPQRTPNGDVKNEALGLFAEGTYTFNETWSTTVGIRQSWDERSVTARNYTSSVGGAPTGANNLPVCAMTDVDGNQLPANACEREESADFDSPTWRASLNYTPRDGLLMYGSVSTGYRAGGIDLRGTDNVSLTPFDEETVITYEFGHKADWELGSGSLRTNLAVYLQEYTDIQKTESALKGGTFGTQTANAAEAEIKGLELEATYFPTANLSFNLSYSYVDAEYKEWDKAVQTSTGLATVDYSDAKFTYIPENSLTASAKYTLPLDVSLGEVTIMTSVYWQDEMDTVADAFNYASKGWSAGTYQKAMGASTADDYAVWNLRLDWFNVMGSNFDAAAYVNNATDEAYVVGGLNVLDSLGWASATYGAPRTIGASLRYQF
ncbi:TonB-dependent receptor [Pseudomaricurvus sp.]|uniref:TonB-dependent receptor n=1 Tax=Pseudomaricurvus sp. TaxID=2004510 RepID=UPI003F6B077E